MPPSFEDALALHRNGALDEAAAAYERLIATVPGSFEPAYHLSLLRAQQGRAADALRLAAAAEALAPNDPEVLTHLGTLLLGAARPNEAIPFLERAVSIKPDFARGYNNLGSALLALGQPEDAVLRFRSALSIQPTYADARTNLNASAKALQDLGIAQREMGHIAEARDAYERAIAIDPNPDVFRHLSDIYTFSAGDPYLAQMQGLAENDAALDDDARVDLHFALGKAYADTGEHERSFRHLLTANAIKRGMVEYDETATLTSFETIPKVFSRAVIAAHGRTGDPSPVPVFILGMPRSGTTLIEQILAAHPNVHAAGELALFEEAVAFAFPGDGELLSGQRLRALGAHYVDALRKIAPAAARITDKMPANFRFAGLIALALPNARIIYARRDPVDNCLSCFSLLFQEGQEHTYDLTELGRYYRGYEALMDHWSAALPPGSMLEVRYEDVVADLEGQARRIVAHTGLPWNEACLEFHRVTRPVQTASAGQVRKPIYTTSIGRWRPYGDLLGPLFEALGRPMPP